MTSTQKKSLITRFERSAEPLLAAALAAPVEALDLRPDLADAWTIREHLVHFLDADAFAYARVRLCAAEPGAELFVWDEDKWRSNLEYGSTDLEATVEGIRLLRKLITASARSLEGRDWDALFVMHPKRGRMGIADVLTLYADHADFHLEYLQRNLRLA